MLRILNFTDSGYRRCRRRLGLIGSAVFLLVPAVAWCQCPGALVDGAATGKWGSDTRASVTWSYVEASYTEIEPGNISVTVFPIVDGQNNFPADVVVDGTITEKGARRLVRDAFDTWADVADLTFVFVDEMGTDPFGDPIDPLSVDIRIGAHDGFVGMTLGHGFTPGSSPLAGDVHMNRDRVWERDQLLSSVLHEIGHALGLLHIVDDGTDDVVMYALLPASRPAFPSFKDAAYIQAIYGPPVPAITGVTGAAGAQQLEWYYPRNPTDAMNPVALYTATIAVSAPNVTVTADPVANKHALTGFDIEAVAMTVRDVLDDADGGGDAVLDAGADDDGNGIGWRVDVDTREAGTDNAFQIDIGDTFDMFFSPTYALRSVADRLFTATASSQLRLQRSLKLSGTQSIEYQIVDEQGHVLMTYLEKGATLSGPLLRQYADAPDEGLSGGVSFDAATDELVFDLSSLSDTRINVQFTFNNGGAFFTDQNGIPIEDAFLDNVTLSTVRTEAPEGFSEFDFSVSPAASSIDVSTEPSGFRAYRMRGTFACDGETLGLFSRTAEVFLTAGSPDLRGAALDVEPDHVVTGAITVTFTVENAGSAGAGAFQVAIVVSDDAILGNGDDSELTVVDFDMGLGAGSSIETEVPLSLDRMALFARAITEDPPQSSGAPVSTSVDYIGIIVDKTDQAAESDESNNANVGQGFDSDDITFFPWDVNPVDGSVTPTDAMFVINRLGTTPVGVISGDLDANGEITPTDAISVINRIGYTINPGVDETAPKK